jgi:glycosyltransferase involved in cell wall biosynthesis
MQTDSHQNAHRRNVRPPRPDPTNAPGPAAPVARRPRILLVTDRRPGQDSGYGIRVDNVINGLKLVGDLHVCLVDSSTGGESLPLDAGYETTVVRAENPSKLRKLGIAITGLAQLPYRRRPELRAEVARRVGHETWDLVWYSRVRTYELCHHVIPASRVIVDFDDLNDRLVSSLVDDRTRRRGRLLAAPRNALGRIEVRRWSRLQRRIAGEVDSVAVCSDFDRDHLGHPNVAVVRDGYRDPGPTNRSPDLANPTLLFVGPLSYEPNRLAAEWLAFEVLPRVRRQVPDARVVLVGYNAGASRDLRGADGVSLAGWVHDLDTYYSAAAVAVAPLQSGGGTRLKVMEALARSIPLVSTSTGCFGLDLTPGEDLVVVDDADGFAEACVSLIRDPDLAERLTRRGLATFRQHLTAEASSTAVADLARAMIEWQPHDLASGAHRPDRARRDRLGGATLAVPLLTAAAVGLSQAVDHLALAQA